MASLRTLLVGALVAGCGGGGSEAKTSAGPVKVVANAEPKEKRGEYMLHPSTKMLRVHIQNLADDTHQGRRPGTEGGRTTEMYVEAQMKSLGLEPAGDDGSFRQRVPMRGVTLDLASAAFTVSGGTGEALALATGSRLVATSFAAPKDWSHDGGVVFAGYGVTAPEFEWDDYAGIDVKGKVVVVLVGDPPVTDGRFGGAAMTYYGRWSYKFERALEAGAAACLVIHESAPASYGWNVVESSWSGERFGLRQADGPLPPALTYQGWLHRDAAEALAVRVGTTLEQWHADALTPGFRAKALPLRLAATFKTSEREIEADNIVGAVPGSTNDDEAIVITAHWDHLGLSPTPIDGDVVFNGAVDNASGIAGMLGVAASLQEQVAAGTGPKRRVVFLATTAEEQGLLGSRYYAEHPLVPIDKIIAVANLDSMNVHGRTKSVVVVGAGQSTLEDTLADVVAKQGRHTIPDDRPEGGGYYRSDHFSFARRGVPALYFRGSTDLVDGGTAAGVAIAKLRSERYHTVRDEYDPNWSLEGALQDVEALVDLVLRVANADQRPAWKPASEFGNAG